MTEKVYINNNNSAGIMAGIIASVLAVIGILFFGIVFVPLALVFTIVGMFLAVKNKNSAGIGVNILAFILVVIGIFTSPALLAVTGGIFTAAAN